VTYSIVARDPATGELGVAVQTRWFDVGAFVPWVAAGVGAVATQSFTEVAHGPGTLARLADGLPAEAVLRERLAADGDAELRQIGIVDAAGMAAAHTGARCVRFAAHLTAADVSVQANMMERPTVPGAMLAAFRAADGDLAARLMAALRAAEAEGGDVRGRQSAALLVAPGGRGGDPRPEAWRRRFDLRVDDHRAPLDELARLLRVARAYEAMDAAETAALAGDVAAAVPGYLHAADLAPEDDQVLLWAAAALAASGRSDEARAWLARAVAVEPRAPEHLRRFAEAGHLPGGRETLAALGIAAGADAGPDGSR
jgi:uncharacterized Ntn-hydrolase superfamily protein